MYPYYVETDSTVDLFQLSDGRFQMTKQGQLGPLLVGHKYVLVEKSLVETFESIGVEGACFSPVVIFNRKLNSEVLGYYELTTEGCFSSEEIDGLDLSGLKILVMDDRYLFVSPKLKEKIEKTSMKLIFSCGFGKFA